MILRHIAPIQRSGSDRDTFLLTVKDSKISPVEFIPDQRAVREEKDRFWRGGARCGGSLSLTEDKPRNLMSCVGHQVDIVRLLHQVRDKLHECIQPVMSDLFLFSNFYKVAPCFFNSFTILL